MVCARLMGLPATDVLARRQGRIRRSLASLGLDALVVTAFPNIRYLSNHVGSAGVLVLTQNDAHLMVDFRYEAAVQALQTSAAACPSLRIWPVPASYDEALLGCLVAIGVRTVGIEGAHLTVGALRVARSAGGRAQHGARVSIDVACRGRSAHRKGPLGADDASRGRRGDWRRSSTPQCRLSARPDGTGRGGGNRGGHARRGIRAAGLRHDRRIGAERRIAASSGRRSGALEPATSSCWTLAASWTDTAAI